MTMKHDGQEWRTITVQKGESLHDALRKQNCAPDLVCGGKGVCGLCSVEVEKFGKVKSCRFRMAGTYRVRVPGRAAFDVVTAIDAAALDGACAAIDIGTTTVAWTVVCGGRARSGGFVNPQRKFGADVMSRIRFCSEGHLKELRDAITEELRRSIEPELCGCRETVRVAIAANTTMLHILNGWDTSGLGKAPFAPKSTAMRQWRDDRVSVTELPGISAFVGADIVSGLYALNAQEQTEPVFFLDLGTNGEMAVGANGRFFVTSAAAGPAFEASELALSIHASGLLAVLHEMLDAGVMDENGTLCDRYFDSGYPVGASVLTQDLIRELQMAKAAIRAGIEILIRTSGIPAEEIQTLYLAGGMGYYIDPEDAIAVGLIPQSFRGKISPAGNTSLQGALRFLGEEADAREALAKITEGAKEIILAGHPDFEELYIRYMSFE